MIVLWHTDGTDEFAANLHMADAPTWREIVAEILDGLGPYDEEYTALEAVGSVAVYVIPPGTTIGLAELDAHNNGTGALPIGEDDMRMLNDVLYHDLPAIVAAWAADANDRTP